MILGCFWEINKSTQGENIPKKGSVLCVKRVYSRGNMRQVSKIIWFWGKTKLGARTEARAQFINSRVKLKD